MLKKGIICISVLLVCTGCQKEETTNTIIENKQYVESLGIVTSFYEQDNAKEVVLENEKWIQTGDGLYVQLYTTKGEQLSFQQSQSYIQSFEEIKDYGEIDKLDYTVQQTVGKATLIDQEETIKYISSYRQQDIFVQAVQENYDLYSQLEIEDILFDDQTKETIYFYPLYYHIYDDTNNIYVAASYHNEDSVFIDGIYMVVATMK